MTDAVELMPPEIEDYIAVHSKSDITCGGSQMHSPDKNIRHSGCGLVAALDLILYLGHRENKPVMGTNSRELDLPLYNALLDFTCRRYLAVLPHFGINGIALTFAVNLMFRRHSLPYRARWCFTLRKFEQSIAEMLSCGIPVVFAAGPSLPPKRHTLALYRRNADGKYIHANSISGHYMTILADMGDGYYRITSWGREYFISREQFIEYARKKSLPVVSNILYVKRK